jgi:peroxin-5
LHQLEGKQHSLQEAISALSAQQRYDEAAQHILDALVLQGQDVAEEPQTLPVSRGVSTSSLWDSLKTTYLHLQRSDLASLCDERNLTGIRTALEANYI